MPGLACEDVLGALVAVVVGAGAGDAGHHDHVALALELVDEELGQLLAELHLVGVDGQAALVVDGVVERHDHDAAVAGLLDHAVEAAGRRGVDDDRVDALGDQVGDLLRLGRHVVAGVEDAAVDLLGVRRHGARRLEHVLHLDPPLVADERVGQGDLQLPVRRRRCRVRRRLLQAAAINSTAAAAARSRAYRCRLMVAPP